MVKVNFITTWKRRCGIADYSQFLIEELRKYGDMEINIVPLENPSSRNPLTFYNLLNSVDKDEITHIQYQPGLFGYVPHLPYFINYLPLTMFRLKYLLKNRIITTVHEFVLESIFDRINLKFLNLSEKLIVHNQHLKKTLENEGIEPEKIIYMPHGTPPGKSLDKKDSQKKLGILGYKVLTVFGFIHPNKGHDLLIEALSQLDDDYILLIAGEARIEEHENFYNDLKIQTRKLGLEERVKFLDYIPEENIPLIFSATDLAIFPYRWIITSGSFHLALSYLTPTLTSDIDYFQETKEKYNCIELFQSGNVEDLKKKILKLADDPSRQEYLKEQCKKFNADTSWEAVARKTRREYLKLYKSS